MRLTLYHLVFHENLFYATREIGRLYETGRYLHNYALTYSLGLVQSSYFHAQQIPAYAEELEVLNEQKVYVTPARGIDIRYQLVTFKFANNAYRVKMEPSSRNIPTFGRAKEIATGSVFEFAVIHPGTFHAPRWIRMGLWRSKALVKAIGEGDLIAINDKEQTASLPLNPLDIEGRLKIFDLISMPPSSLIENARIETDWLKVEVNGRKIYLPAAMRYTFPQSKRV